jgi:hypothetical protein
MATAGLTGQIGSTGARPAPSLWHAGLTAYAGIWTFTLTAGAVVYAAPGGPALARQLLALKLSAVHNPPPTIGLVLSIALNNTLRSTWPLLLGPLGAQRNRITRMLADGAVLANLLVASLLVGGALGGYGLRVLPYLAHVPVEWAGIAVGASGWLIERQRPTRTSALVGALASLAVLLLCAALLEATLAPHRVESAEMHRLSGPALAQFPLSADASAAGRDNDPRQHQPAAEREGMAFLVVNGEGRRGHIAHGEQYGEKNRQ